MAAPVDVKVEGLRELSKALRAVDKKLPKEVAKIHKKIAGPVAKKAAAKAPRGKTGRLSASIKAYGTQKAAAIGAGVRLPPYAGVIHYGWPAHNIKAAPFLTEALHESERDMVNSYEVELEDFINAVWPN